MQSPKKSSIKRRIVSSAGIVGLLGALGGKIAHNEIRSQQLNRDILDIRRQKIEQSIRHDKEGAQAESSRKKRLAEWEAKQKQAVPLKPSAIRKSGLPVRKEPVENNYFERFQSMDFPTAVAFFKKKKKVMRQQYTSFLTQMSPAQRIARAQRNKRLYAPLVEKYAKLSGVDPLLAKKIVQKESSWDPIAVSSTGAFGLCQVNSYIYASRFFPKYRHNPFRVEDTIKASMSYLGALTRKYAGNQQKISTAFYLGEPVVDNAIKSNANWVQDSKVASSTYYAEVMSQKI